MNPGEQISASDAAWLGVFDALKMIAALLAYYCVKYYRQEKLRDPDGLWDWTRLVGVALVTPLALSVFMSVTGFIELLSSDVGGFIRVYVLMLCCAVWGLFARLQPR